MGIFLVGSLIQTIILINNENYAFPNYHGTLLAIGAMVVAWLANTYGAKALPYWQNALFAVHILAYFAYIVPIWVNAPTASHGQVWGEFANEGGWSSVGMAVLVGQLSGIGQQVGVDTVSITAEHKCQLQLTIILLRPHTWPKKSKTPAKPSPAPC